MRQQREMSIGIVLLMVTSGLTGCDGVGRPSSPSAPSQIPRTAPTPAPQPPAVELAVFTDAATGFSTSDVRDVQGQIVRFNTADELVWVANDNRFAEYLVDGTFIGYHHKADRIFQVRFGTRDGERRAYLSWPDDRLTIVDLWVDERGDLKVAETSVAVPRT